MKSYPCPFIFLFIILLPLETFALPRNAEGRLKQLEDISRTYIRGGTMEAYRDIVFKGVNSYNKKSLKITSSLDERYTQLAQKKKRLEIDFKSIEAYDKQLDRLKNQKNQTKNYNKIVEKRNLLVDSVNKENKILSAEIDKYNQTVRKYEAQSKRDLAKIEQAQAVHSKELEAYLKWKYSGKDIEFWHNLDILHEELFQDQKENGLSTKSKELMLRLKILRHKVSNAVVEDEENSENGLFLVKANFGSGISGLFIIDTGASITTISKSFITRLGLEDELGENIQCTLANGSMVEGRLVTLPYVSCQSASAKDIEAVVMPGPSLGIDGLLGHSFLDNFVYTVDKRKKPSVSFIRRIKKEDSQLKRF